MAMAFKVGDLVWAKMKGFPPWPGLVSEPPENKKLNEKKPRFYIFFFGSDNYAWVTFDNMWPYLEKREEYVAMLRPTHSFQEAVDAIDDYVREHGGTIPPSPKKSPSLAKQSDNEEEKTPSGRRSRKRPSSLILETPISSKKADKRPKSVKKGKENENKKREKGAKISEKALSDKKKDLVEGARELLVKIKTKELDKENEGEEDNEGEVEHKSKRISRKRNDEEEEEEEEGIEGEPSLEAEEEKVEIIVKEKSEEIKEEEKEEDGAEKDDEVETAEKMLVDEETAKKLNEMSRGGGDGGKINNEKESKENKKDIKVIQTPKKKVKQIIKESKKDIKAKKEAAKEMRTKTKTPATNKTKIKEESSRKKETSAAALKRKSLSEKRNDSSKKKTYLPDVLSSTTTTETTTSILKTTTTTKLNKKFSTIVPTKKKIGFIGSGNIGIRLIRCLLASKHQVLLWNRTSSKCKDLLKKGAGRCSSPSDVVRKADIIISCVSDDAAFKDVIFGSNGILQSMKEGKGLVNLSTVDVETTLDACEAVTGAGGQYLEAAMIGSLENASKGEMLILVSGDQQLYEDCNSVFKALSKNIFNLVDIGTATKMQVVLNSLYGTTIAGLAEGLSLASKVGIDPAEVLEVVSHTSVVSNLIRQKGEAMVKNNLSEVDIRLDTLQKDIRLAINMSEDVDQPLHVGSVVNELFKKAKANGYGESDVAAVYRATDL